MLSTTSLLHGNCIFNRNNTVATQQGMKTYWLCKSYRITMCRARCITHQGRVISATGVHNHQPHMKSSGAEMLNSLPPGSGMRLPQGVVPGQNPSQGNSLSAVVSQASMQMSNLSPQQSMNAQQIHQQHQNHHHQAQSHHHQTHPNVMHNVLSHNNLMQLSNMNPILNPGQHHGSANIHAAAANLQGTHNSAHHLHSPNSTQGQQRSSVVQQQQQQSGQESGNLHHNTTPNSQTMPVTPTSVAASPGVPSQQQSTPPSDDSACQSHDIPVSSATNLLSPSSAPSFKMEHSM